VRNPSIPVAAASPRPATQLSERHLVMSPLATRRACASVRPLVDERVARARIRSIGVDLEPNGAEGGHPRLRCRRRGRSSHTRRPRRSASDTRPPSRSLRRLSPFFRTDRQPVRQGDHAELDGDGIRGASVSNGGRCDVSHRARGRPCPFELPHLGSARLSRWWSPPGAGVDPERPAQHIR